jgi:hypothetical protein
MGTYQVEHRNVKNVPAGESQHRPRPNPWRATVPDQYRWDVLGRKWRQNQRDCRELMIAYYACGTTATIDRLAHFLAWNRDRVKRTLRDCERLGCLVRGEKIGRWVTRGGITFFHCTGVRRHLRLEKLLPRRKSESAPQAPRMCTEEVPESLENRNRQKTHDTEKASAALVTPSSSTEPKRPVTLDQIELMLPQPYQGCFLQSGMAGWINARVRARKANRQPILDPHRYVRSVVLNFFQQHTMKVALTILRRYAARARNMPGGDEPPEPPEPALGCSLLADLQKLEREIEAMEQCRSENRSTFGVGGSHDFWGDQDEHWYRKAKRQRNYLRGKIRRNEGA